MWEQTKEEVPLSHPSTLRQNQLISRRLRDDLIREPYIIPGIYPKFAVTSDGGVLCSKCCKSEHKSIGFCYPNDGWQIVGIDINYDEELYCSHCNNKIE